MKTSMLSSFLIVAFAALALAPIAVAEEPAAALVAPVVAEAPAVDAAPLAEDAICPAPDANLAPVVPIDMAWDCPYNAPFCSYDDQCDAYCGDPRFGACVAPGCCSCYG